jgi:signal transduction histidine kinase
MEEAAYLLRHKKYSVSEVDHGNGGYFIGKLAFIFHPVEPTLVNADHDKIGQVINNFISNAVKYSKADTTIQVSCIQVNGFTQVSVTDEGMGINKDDISKLFERYFRVDNNNKISGFGIGLYLSAEIIERHQGKIWAESEPGKGSIFYFTLPLAI